VAKLQSALKGIDSLSNWTGKITSYLMIGMFAVIIYEIVVRYIVHSPTTWAHVLSILMMGVYVVIPGAYALVTKTHVVVDTVYGRFSLRTRAIVDVATSVFFFFWCAVLLWGGTKFAIRSVLQWEHYPGVWSPPIWQVKVAIPLAATLLLLQGIAKLIRDGYIAVKGQELK